MIKYLPLLFLAFVIGCKTSSADRSELLRESKAWSQYSTIDSIPKALINRFKQLNGGSFQLANANKDYQVTDIILNERLPQRQLGYLGNNKNFWIVIYKHAEFVFTTTMFFVK